MKTTISGLSRGAAAEELQITRKTLAVWTDKGLIEAATWTSPGGRVYVGYAVAAVRRLQKEMGLA